MKRNRLFALTSLVAVLLAVAPLKASQFPSVATASTSCVVDQATKLKELDPLRNEVFFQNPGSDQRISAIVTRFPVAPHEYGVNKIKGKVVVDYSCFNGTTQQSRGRDKDKFGMNGSAAMTQRIPAGANCFFSAATAGFTGSQKQPAGADIEFLLGAQAVVPGADPACFDKETICLGEGNRFRVEVDWRDFSGQSGGAVAFPRSEDSGLFYFFNEVNTELLVKVLNGCDFNDHFWVFAGALTNVEYTLRVTDTETGQSQAYFNPLGQPAPAITDTQAFATCP